MDSSPAGLGGISGITPTAKWMWCDVIGDVDPLQGGATTGEYLIFSIPVPAPGAAAVAGLGGFVALRRRR